MNFPALETIERFLERKGLTMLRKALRVLAILIVITALYQFFGGDVVGAIIAFVSFIGDIIGQIAAWLASLPLLNELFNK